MIIRLLGLQEAALSENSKSVFDDVSDSHWAVKYINYAYKNKIVQGVSAKAYDPNGLMTGKQFIALVLRALRYQEAKTDTAFPLAVQSGLLSLKRAEELTEKADFRRGDMVEVAYDALCSKVKGSPKTLLQKLVEDNKVVSKQSALQSGLYSESSLMDSIDDAIEEKLKN
ncbi:MAG: S-layer homology domain-containing protein [Clostridia bacterium]